MRTDGKGRKLRQGEYYDELNDRYIFRKMIQGKRYNITNSNLSDLRKEEVKLLSLIESGQYDSEKKKEILLDDYFEEWSANSARLGRKSTTLTNYRSYYNTHVKGSEIGKKQLGKISRIDCEKLFNSMIAKGYKKSTLNNMKGCLILVFSSAEDEGIIAKNPCKNIRFSDNIESGKREAIPEEHVNAFMGFIKDDSEFSIYYPLFVLLFNSGARIGEIMALTWDDVDLENGTLQITKSLNRYRKKEYGYTMAIGSVKTKQSNREISLNDLMKKALQQQKKLQFILPRQNKPIPRVDDYGRIVKNIENLIFLQSNGSCWNEPTICKLIHRIVDKQNKSVEGKDKLRINYFTPHEIRHTYSTLAYEVGADQKAVSQRLGHASERITQETYTHLRGEKKKKQEEVIKQIRIG